MAQHECMLRTGYQLVQGVQKLGVKGGGKRFLHGDLICIYTQWLLSEYISDIYVDGSCIVRVKT